MIRFVIAIAVLLTVGFLFLWSGAIRIPDRWNPWGPIDLAEPPNLLTTYKLRRLRDDPAACLAVLAESRFNYTPIPDRVTGEGCAFRNAVRVAGSDVAYGGGFVASCPLAVGLALFETHALQPEALSSFGQPVVAIDHFGTYACRNVNNQEVGRRSEHATANAIDIAGFRLRDGRRIVLRRDWGGDDAEARFLRRLQERACVIFSVALGPDYNAAHRDHFHVDMGPFSTCR